MRSIQRAGLSLLGSLLLLVALFLPWWSATARLPDGSGAAQLTLYSFRFDTSGFSCTTVLAFYPYGECPLLGSGPGVAMLSFYLFWSLFFLAVSFSLGIVSAVFTLRGEVGQLSWLPVVSVVLSVLSNSAFVAGLATAGLKFVEGSALLGTSSVLSWSVSAGFLVALVSTIVQFARVYYGRPAA